MADALRQAAAWLADAGYEVVDTPTPGFTRAKELWFAMQMPEVRLFMWPAIEQYGDAGIRRAMGFMLDAHPAEGGAAYMKALAERARVVREWQGFFERVPLVLAPVCTEPPYARGFDVESRARTAALWRECVTLTAVPVLGVPALAVPTGIVDGLPVGVQVVAARFREDLCLAAGEAIEARAGVAPRLPIDIAW
ncbi:MAG: amidase family protein [Acidobacteriota bacterium]|nr:amidase family protein [Acidobacteriota bacterium]